MRDGDTPGGIGRIPASVQEAVVRIIVDHIRSGSVRGILLLRRFHLLPSDPVILLRKGSFETDNVRPHRGILRSGIGADRCVDLQIFRTVLNR